MNVVSFPGLGLEFTLNRVAVELFGRPIYWYGVIIASGLLLDDGLQCMPAGLKILSAGEESEAHVTLREGKFHQVKRMLAYLGKPVLYLERISMGNMTLDPDLPRGKFRFLAPEEVEGLRKS